MAKYPALSYTAIKSYETCPFRFYQEKILKTVPYVQTPEAELGDKIHKELEDYIKRDGQVELQLAKPYQPIVEHLRQLPGQKQVETKMAMDWQCRQVDYFKGRDIWIRGQYDFIAIDQNGIGKMIDYKTGSAKYPDTDQLELMSVLAFLHEPDLKETDCSLIFLKHNVISKARFTRAKMPQYIEKWKARSIPICQSVETKNWPARKGPLCGWCPIMDCRFHPKFGG